MDQTVRASSMSYTRMFILVTDSIQFTQQNLTQDVFEGFGNFKIRAKNNSQCNNADRLVLIAKEETTLKGITDILFVI